MRLFLAALVTQAFLGTVPLQAGSRDVVVYKDPACMCCSAYSEYLRANGFAVTVVEEADMVARHLAAGTPEGFEGCHLSLIDGYVVEGHVPVAAIEKLLAERPGIAGISLPGMPQGSPGMGGEKTESFLIFGFGPEAPSPFFID